MKKSILFIIILIFTNCNLNKNLICQKNIDEKDIIAIALDEYFKDYEFKVKKDSAIVMLKSKYTLNKEFNTNLIRVQSKYKTIEKNCTNLKIINNDTMSYIIQLGYCNMYKKFNNLFTEQDVKYFKKNENENFIKNYNGLISDKRIKLMDTLEFLKYHKKNLNSTLDRIEIRGPFFSKSKTIALLQLMISTKYSIDGSNCYLVYRKVKNDWVEIGNVGN